MRFCTLSSGSSGNSVFLEYKKTRILIDCGKSCRYISSALENIGSSPGEISAILVTHEHNDHILGVGAIARKYNIPVYATAGTWASMENKIGFVGNSNIKYVVSDRLFDIMDLGVYAFETPHDAFQPVGYNLFAGNLKISVATDIGHISSAVMKNVSGSDLVFLESNYDYDKMVACDYPMSLKKRIMGKTGHLSNDDAADFAALLVKGGTKYIMLGHLSKESNTSEIAHDTTVEAFSRSGISCKDDVLLRLAERDRCSYIFDI